MKRAVIFVLLFGSGILFAFSGNANAQKKVAEFKELYGLEAKAQRTLYSRQRRVERNNEMFENSVVVKSDYSLYEYLADDKSRYVSRRMEGGKTSETESIFLGYFRYTRTDNGPWTKTDMRAVGDFGTGSGSSAGGGCAVRQLTVESVFIGNFPARLFEKIDISKHDDGLLVEEERTWFGENGDLLQEESITGTYSPRTMMIRTSVKYEYEPNIKIDAPIP